MASLPDGPRPLWSDHRQGSCRRHPGGSTPPRVARSRARRSTEVERVGSEKRSRFRAGRDSSLAALGIVPRPVQEPTRGREVDRLSSRSRPVGRTACEAEPTCRNLEQRQAACQAEEDVRAPPRGVATVATVFEMTAAFAPMRIRMGSLVRFGSSLVRQGSSPPGRIPGSRRSDRACRDARRPRSAAPRPSWFRGWRPRRITAIRSQKCATTARSWLTRMLVSRRRLRIADRRFRDLGLNRDVERRGRLVEQEDLRFEDQGAGQGHALTLSARKLVRGSGSGRPGRGRHPA